MFEHVEWPVQGLSHPHRPFVCPQEDSVMIPPGFVVLADGTIIGKRGKPLKGYINPKSGYVYYGSRIDGKLRHFMGHLLVCEAFHGPKPFPEAQVRHLDGNPANNNARNLKWGTS